MIALDGGLQEELMHDQARPLHPALRAAVAAPGGMAACVRARKTALNAKNPVIVVDRVARTANA